MSKLVTLQATGDKLAKIREQSPADTLKTKPRVPRKKVVKREGGEETAMRLNAKALSNAPSVTSRPLDKSDWACRKWVKKPMELRSFTGVGYTLQAWCGEPGQPTDTSTTATAEN